MHSRSTRTATTRTLVCVLAFALWVAATLGLLHRTLHGQPAAPAAAAGPLAAAGGDLASRAGKERRPAQGLAALFGDHDDADCRLYDQLANGPAALGVPLVILPVTLAAATFACFEGEAVARWAALFDARGPPRSR
ncbi:MAG: hypothetical protein J7549_06320 [Variovorax sp.]|nr:hypothetical protein [Variovorax sp.]